jgi:magnesium-transporting ATPase (P-type)
MKKLLNKISTSLLYSMLFAAFFMGIGTLLSMAFFGMNFSQKLLSAHTISEKWRQGTAFYLSAMLVQFVILLISKHRKLLNSGYRLMVMGGISGMVMLPIALVMGYLLSGPILYCRYHGIS